MQAIETVYKGYRFRSRLEARWAVFFDAIGRKWEYEPEGFALQTGHNYLPDFWLPEDETYVEIKPTVDVITKYDTDRYREFSKHVYFCVLIGTPELPVFKTSREEMLLATIVEGCWAKMYFKGQDRKLEDDPRPWIWQERVIDESLLLWPCFAMEPVVTDEQRRELKRLGIASLVAFLPGMETGIDVVLNPEATKLHDSPKLVNAYLAARQARFEFGESGAPAKAAAPVKSRPPKRLRELPWMKRARDARS